MANCLFVIDVQVGFVTKETEYVIKRIQNLLRKNLFDYVVFTKFINQEGSPFTDFLNWQGLISPEEQEIHPNLKSFADTVFSKTAYTAINEETLRFIKEKRISEAYVAGMDTDGCVLATAIDLFQNHVRPYVLEYYCASTLGTESHKSAIKVLEGLIGSKHIISNAIDSL